MKEIEKMDYTSRENNNFNLMSLFNNTKPKTIYRVEIKNEYDK